MLTKELAPVIDEMRPQHRPSAPSRRSFGPELNAAVAVLANRYRKRRHLRAVTICGDLIAIILAFSIAGYVRFNDLAVEQVWAMLTVVLPVYLAIAVNQRAYHQSTLIDVAGGVRAAFFSFVVTLGVVGLVVYFLKVSDEFSRIMLGIGALIALLTLPCTRYLSAISMRRFMGKTIQNVVVIEDGEAVASTDGQVVLNAERDHLKPLLHDPLLLDRLGHCLRHADRVIVACPPQRRTMWAMALKGADVEAEVLAPELDELGVLDFGRVGDRRTFVVASGPLGRVDQMLKRVLDVTLISSTLPLIAPLMLLVAIAVRLESRGPILFRQQRVGLGNRLFTVYKFRSMHVDRLDGAGARSTARNDDRVTRVGRFIRRTSLDELPQIFNVLIGTMSIVGPRPHALGSTAEEKLYWDIDTSYWHRHAVKPGITGLAQIQGFRGTTEREGDLRDRLQADLQYVNGWTIWRDLKIIFATFRVVVHKNAF